MALRVAGDEGVIEPSRRVEHGVSRKSRARRDVPLLRVAAELDGSQMAWRRSEGEVEDPALFAMPAGRSSLRRRMPVQPRPGTGPMGSSLELSYDTPGLPGAERQPAPRPSKLSCWNVEKLREEVPRGLPAIRARRSARWRGLGQAQHQRVAAAAFSEGHRSDQGRGGRSLRLYPSPTAARRGRRSLSTSGSTPIRLRSGTAATS